MGDVKGCKIAWRKETNIQLETSRDNRMVVINFWN
jgi:hypothetical protein